MDKRLKDIIDKSNNIVFFGGAGVSTASGIPDFRSENGLYNMDYKYAPEEILSHSFFFSKTKEFYQFYKKYMNALDVLPNIVHNKLVELEKEGKLKCIITQNIDGLHDKAGSKNVLEIHGSIYRNYCIKCHKFYDASVIFSAGDIPYCECGGIIKPDVVLYEEPLNDTFEKAIDYVSNCDTLIVAGTSLNVYPAANLLRYFNGENLVLINKSKTSFDNYATLVINDDLVKVFGEL